VDRVDNAQALVTDDEERVLLLLDRSGQWGFPGGRRTAGETLAEAAERETKRKTGLTIEIVRIAAVGEFLTRLSDVHHLFVVFASRVVDGTAELQGEQTVLELQWVKPEDADYLVPWFPGGVKRLIERDDALYYAHEGFE
jgi:8-oxo-dGTP diphosphatase